jgi:hypothetical protein
MDEKIVYCDAQVIEATPGRHTTVIKGTRKLSLNIAGVPGQIRIAKGFAGTRQMMANVVYVSRQLFSPAFVADLRPFFSNIGQLVWQFTPIVGYQTLFPLSQFVSFRHKFFHTHI